MGDSRTILTVGNAVCCSLAIGIALLARAWFKRRTKSPPDAVTCVEPFDLHFTGSCGFNIGGQAFVLSKSGDGWQLEVCGVDCDNHTEEILRSMFVGPDRPHLELITARTVYLFPKPVLLHVMHSPEGTITRCSFFSAKPLEVLPNYQVA